MKVKQKVQLSVFGCVIQRHLTATSLLLPVRDGAQQTGNFYESWKLINTQAQTEADEQLGSMSI